MRHPNFTIELLTMLPKLVQVAFEETRLALRLPNVPAPAAVLCSRPR